MQRLKPNSTIAIATIIENNIASNKQNTATTELILLAFTTILRKLHMISQSSCAYITSIMLHITQKSLLKDYRML